jgi:hypothetical protein
VLTKLERAEPAGVLESRVAVCVPRCARRVGFFFARERPEAAIRAIAMVARVRPVLW